MLIEFVDRVFPKDKLEARVKDESIEVLHVWGMVVPEIFFEAVA